MKKINLVGQKYNRLTVIREITNTDYFADKRVYWLCKCDCGNEKIIVDYNVKRGRSKSCGCLNNEKRLLRAKYSPEEASAQHVWRNRYSDMSFEDFYQLSQQNCYYCGALPANCRNSIGKNSSDNRKQNGNFKYNGLDRLDNSEGHSLTNCVPCCKYCNYAKRERTLEEFKEWAKRLYENIIK